MIATILPIAIPANTSVGKCTKLYRRENAISVATAIAARETYLATIKQRQDEYKASKNAASAAAAPAKTGFNF